MGKSLTTSKHVNHGELYSSLPLKNGGKQHRAFDFVDCRESIYLGHQYAGSILSKTSGSIFITENKVQAHDMPIWLKYG